MLTGRAVFLAVAAVTILLLAGIGIAQSGKAELRRRWVTWAIIIPAVGIPIWMGRGTTALLAALLGLQAVRELARLTRLPGAETTLLAILSVAYPLMCSLTPFPLVQESQKKNSSTSCGDVEPSNLCDSCTGRRAGRGVVSTRAAPSSQPGSTSFREFTATRLGRLRRVGLARVTPWHAP